MEPIKDVREISRIAYGFMASKALFAALNLDLFSQLSGTAKSLRALSQDTRVDAKRLEKLLTACVSIGLLTKERDTYGNSPASERYLVKSAPTYFGDYYLFQVGRQIYPLLENLDEALEGKTSEAWYLKAMADPEEADYFSRGQHAGSKGPAHILAQSVDLSAQRSLLDVAGGSGAFTIALCRRFPDLAATILDLPHVIATARRFVSEAGLEARVTLASGNAVEGGWPGRHDAVLCSYFLSCLGRDDIPPVLQHAAETLQPGGLLIIHDFLVNDDQSGPAISAWWSLTSLALTPDSITLTPAYLKGQLLEHGFVNVSFQELIPEITSLIVCRKEG